MMSDEGSSNDLLLERFKNIKEFLQIISNKVSFSSFIIQHSSLSLTFTDKLSTLSRELYPAAAKLCTSAGILYISAGKLHTSASKLHTSAGILYISAEKLHTSAGILYISAEKLHTSASKL